MKALDTSSAAAGAAPDLFKALAIQSDATVRRSSVDQKDLKPYWKSEKRPHFYKWSTILLFTGFSKTSITSKKKTNRVVVFSCRPFINIGPSMRPFNNLENKVPSDTYSRFQLVCIKIQVYISLEPSLVYSQDQMHLMNQASL